MIKQIMSILLILLIAFSAVGSVLAEAPTFDEFGDLDFVEAFENTASTTATDADGEELTFSLVEDSYDSEDTSFSESDNFIVTEVSGEYTLDLDWTPDYYDVGDHVFTLTATDSAGDVTTETFTITVESQYIVALEEYQDIFDEISSEVDDLIVLYEDALSEDDEEDLGEVLDRLEEIFGGYELFTDGLYELLYYVDEANDAGELSNELTSQIEDGVEDLEEDVDALMAYVEETGTYIYLYLNNDVPEFVPFDGMEFLLTEDVAGEVPLLIDDSDDGEIYTLTAVEDSFTSTSSSLDLEGANAPYMSDHEVLYEAIIDWTPTNDDVGEHYVTVTAEDAYGEVISVSVVLVVSDVPDMPEITDIDDQTISVDTTTSEAEVFTYALEVADEDDTEFTYTVSIIGDPSDPTTLEPVNPIEVDTDGVITWTPDTSEVGSTFQVTASATDSTGNMATVSFNIEVVAEAIPTISGFDASYSVTEAEVLSITFTSTESDGEALSFDVNEVSFTGTYATASNIESEATFTDNGDDTHTLTWTPGNDAVGTITASVTVTDASGSEATSDAFTITVADSATAPNIDSIADQTVAIGEALSLTFTASDPEGESISFSMSSSLPTAASFTDNGDGTATLSWTPVAGDDDDYSVTITVTDSGGESSSTSFTIVAGEGAGLSEWEQAIVDLETEFDDIHSNYEDDDLEDEYEDAVDDGDEDDIEDATEDLEDVLEELEDLIDEIDDLREEINDAEDDDDISKDEEDDLEKDLDDLEEDVNDLIDEIQDILGIEDDSESASEYTSNDDSSSSSTTTTTSSDDDDDDIEVEVTTFEPKNDGGSTKTVETTTSFDQIRPLIWLSAGIVVAFALLIFALASLVSRK